ncbi:NADPH-dependent FMN reductase [Paracoccaceae bacterium GXU_MW_L88]
MALKLKVIIGSTRPGRVGPAFGEWIHEFAGQHGKFDVELVDLGALDLPVMDEPNHPRAQDYQHEHTKAWAKIVDDADAFIFVTPEYDYFPPSSLVNAIQYLALEWYGKPAAVLSYGFVSGGLRAAETLRTLLAALNVAPIAQGIPVPFYPQFLGEDGKVNANDQMQEGATGVLNELHKWGTALKTMREA